MKTKLKKRRVFKLLVLVLVLATIVTCFSISFKKNSVPVVIESSVSMVRAVGTSALNSAATTVLRNNIKYSDLFTVRTNNIGEVTIIEANSPNINSIAREIANIAQSNLDGLGVQELNVAVGTFTGISLLMGFGPSLKLKILPIGSANCDFVSHFISAGINQTLHKIYIDVYAEIEIITPLDDPLVVVKAEILVCENLIVGKVPDTYVTFGSDKTVFDLCP